jgi:hypothetical protein
MLPPRTILWRADLGAAPGLRFPLPRILSPAGETAGICGVHSGLIVEMLHLIGDKAAKSEVAFIRARP